MIWLARLITEELDRSQELTVTEDGDTDRRVQAGAGGRPRARKACVRRQVSRPGRLTASPHATGKSHPRGKLKLQADLLELRRDGRLTTPYRPTAQHSSAFVVGPPRAELPIHRLAELGQQPAHRLAGALSLGEDPRDRMLCAQQALGELARRDVVQEGVEASRRLC